MLLVCLLLPGIGVLFAAVLVLLLLWLTRQGLSSVGLRRPDRFGTLLLKALGIASLIYLVDGQFLTPAVERMVGARKDLSSFDDLPGNAPVFLMWLALGWVVGGFLEELVFRGFVIRVGTSLLGSAMTWPLAVLGSVVFGLSHMYQGTVGVVTTGMVSFVFGIVFILSRSNLLLCILVHGLVNTISLTLAFLGWAQLV